jgi:predicted CoA-binding protein
MKEHGYKIIPVNPTATEILGERCYPDLASVPEPVQIVDIFRRAEDVPPVVEQAIKKKARVVWMQEGIVSEIAAALSREAGLSVVMDRCIRKVHEELDDGEV